MSFSRRLTAAFIASAAEMKWVRNTSTCEACAQLLHPPRGRRLSHRPITCFALLTAAITLLLHESKASKSSILAISAVVMSALQKWARDEPAGTGRSTEGLTPVERCRRIVAEVKSEED
jgi:hypothetical protein